MFKMHPRLEADTKYICDLPLSKLVLMNDSRYIWLILIPKLEGASELHDLSNEQTTQLWSEINMISASLKAAYSCNKINVGALGNMVPQLHIHIIARNHDDPAWPGPVWGHSPAVAYNEELLETTISKIKEILPHAN
ncbi:MAG: HIT family protein [Alphaproteobacteria bacterium]|nr:HIT family protein [Alphaproteobacteria bacterium]